MTKKITLQDELERLSNPAKIFENYFEDIAPLAESIKATNKADDKKNRIIKMLENWGVPVDFLCQSQRNTNPKYVVLDALMNSERSPLIVLNRKIDGIESKIKGKIRLGFDGDIITTHFVICQKELQIPAEMNGFVFSDEHKKSLKEVGILGELAEFETKNGKEKYFISIDKETNTLVSMKATTIKIPSQLMSVKLSDQDKIDLLSGGIVWLEGAIKGEKTFDTCVYVDANKRGFSFSKNDKFQQKITRK